MRHLNAEANHVAILGACIQALSMTVGVAALFSSSGCGFDGIAGLGGSGGTAASGSGGAAGASGSGGAAATSGSGGAAGTGGGDPVNACQDPPCLNVINQCPFPLWIRAESPDRSLTPKDAKLNPGGQTGNVRQYDLPSKWRVARVNAFWVDPGGPSPDPSAHDKVEVSFEGGVMNYNITYVDYLALPSQMEAIGPACLKTPSFDPRVACTAPVASVLGGCPEGLLAGKRCLSANMVCTIADNQSSPFCHALDDAIRKCAEIARDTCGIAAQQGNTTPNVYSCSGYFDNQPPGCSPASPTCHAEGNKWCAALNRGMLEDAESADVSRYYRNPPYNTYAKWVHETCPAVYAFAYDDYPAGAGQAGTRSCKADRLDVTFCPGG